MGKYIEEQELRFGKGPSRQLQLAIFYGKGE
jgi:hypothetical protein